MSESARVSVEVDRRSAVAALLVATSVLQRVGWGDLAAQAGQLHLLAKRRELGL